MRYSDRVGRAAGWSCALLVALLILMGYHFANVRFVPIAAGFAILAGVLLLGSRDQQVRSDAIHPGADPGVGGTGR